MMFSVILSIVAETIKLSVNSSVSRLTRYETACLALLISSFKSFSILFADVSSILIEYVDDNKIDEYVERLGLSIAEACDLILEESGKVEETEETKKAIKDAEKKAEYLMKLAIATEYAPTVIDDVEEIEKMIYLWGCGNQVSIVTQNKGIIMKMIMPWLKQNHCDMKVAQIALKNAMAKGDSMVDAIVNA